MLVQHNVTVIRITTKELNMFPGMQEWICARVQPEKQNEMGMTFTLGAFHFKEFEKKFDIVDGKGETVDLQRHEVAQETDAILPKKLADELNASLFGLMDHRELNPNGSDYCCVFCGKESVTNFTPVVHKDDCLGSRLQAALQDNV